MKKPVAKTMWVVASAVVIVLAALVIPTASWRDLPALSTTKNTGVKVAVPAGIRQVVCPGLPAGNASAWVKAASLAGEGTITDSGGKTISRENPKTVAQTGLQLQVNPLQGRSGTAIGYVSGSGTQNENGFFADYCAPPVNRAHFLTPGTMVGNASTLHLVNPAGRAVTVQIQIWSEQGPLGGKITQNVPAKGSSALILDGQASGFNRLGVLVEAEGAGVSSWVSSTLATGAQKEGASYSPRLASPENELVIPAAKITDKASLRVLNSNSAVATLQVSLLNTKGETPVSSPKKLQVARGAVFDIPLGGVQDGVAAVKLKSNQPVVAAVFAEETVANQPTLAIYPSVSPSTSGAVLVTKQSENLSFESSYPQKITLVSGEKRQEITLSPGKMAIVKLSEGLWQWQSEHETRAGQLVGDIAGTFRTIGVEKAASEAGAISVKVNP